MSDLRTLIANMQQRILAGERVPDDELKAAIAAARLKYTADASATPKAKRSSNSTPIDPQKLLDGL